MLQTLERVSKHCGSERARAQQKVAQYTCGSTSLIILPYIHNEMQIYEARPSLSLIHSVVKPRSSSFSLAYIPKDYDGFLDILHIYEPMKAQRYSQHFRDVEQLYLCACNSAKGKNQKFLAFIHTRFSAMERLHVYKIVHNDVNLQKNEIKLEFEFRSLDGIFPMS